MLLLALADVTRDARTLNLARALSKAGLNVAVFGAYITQQREPFSMLTWSDPGGRAVRRWWSFRSQASKLSVVARCVVGMDLFALSAARLIARRCDVSLLYDMRELYFALGPLEGKGMRQRILAAHERSVLRDVDDVIVSGLLDAEIVRKHFKLTSHPVVLLNTPPYRDVVASKLRDICGVSRQTVLALYQGVVLHGRGLGPFINAMPTMPNVHLAIVGDGPARQALEARARTVGVDQRVTWLGSVPYDELHSLTCGADVALCLIEPVSMSYEYALPNKLFEAMMARVPSIVTDLPALHDHVMRHPVGVLVDRSLSVPAIRAALERVTSAETHAQMVRTCEDIHSLAYERQSKDAVSLFREHLK